MIMSLRSLRRACSASPKPSTSCAQWLLPSVPASKGRHRVARRAGHRAQSQGTLPPGQARALQGAALCHPRGVCWRELLKAKAEPALILTPPKDGATIAELEEDDGLLTASEVGQLELDADWVVLSACNTAAGDVGDAEALSAQRKKR